MGTKTATYTIKTKEEIKTMQEGGRRHAEILRALAEMVKPGTSSLILEEEALRLVKSYGDKPAHKGYMPPWTKRKFPAALCISINDEIVHGVPETTQKVLEQGDIVSLDLALEHNGLITDSAITVSVGAVDDEARRLLEATKRALALGIKAAMPGNYTGDIGEAISDVIEAAGFSIADGLAGHGIGYDLHEGPYVPNFGRAGTGTKLVPGMVIAIEPIVNAGKPITITDDDGYTVRTLDGSRSAHFEHTVAITKEGNIILTQL